MNGSKVRPHLGRMLMLAAGKYPNLLDVILEVVQNAIDSNARNVYVVFDQKRRRFVVQDDGDGASVEMFNQALGQVGVSMKSQSKLGQFGLGLVSPLGKCVRFTFTSCPKGVHKGYIRWTFVTKDIEGAHHEIVIPHEELSEMRFVERSDLSKSNKTAVTWRTQVAINNFTKDKIISRISGIDEIVHKVFDRFGVAMHKKQVLLHVRFINEFGATFEKGNLEPPRYTGEAMDPYTYHDKEGGSNDFLTLSC